MSTRGLSNMSAAASGGATCTCRGFSTSLRLAGLSCDACAACVPPDPVAPSLPPTPQPSLFKHSETGLHHEGRIYMGQLSYLVVPSCAGKDYRDGAVVPFE